MAGGTWTIQQNSGCAVWSRGMCPREEVRRRYPPPLKRTTSAYSSWTDLCFTDRPRKNTSSPAPRIPPVMSTTAHACPSTPQSYTNIPPTFTDVTEVLLLRASARALHPSSPMPLPAERDGDTDGPCKHVPHPPSSHRTHALTTSHTHAYTHNPSLLSLREAHGHSPALCHCHVTRTQNRVWAQTAMIGRRLIRGTEAEAQQWACGRCVTPSAGARREALRLWYGTWSEK